MRWVVIGLLLLTAACKKTETTESMPHQADVSGKAGPDVGATQTAGLALSYAYGFRLPIERVASVQEQHAQQCEKLTPFQCRVTGMTYQAGRDRTITASLHLKLAPEIARRFGKQGVDTVVAQGGMLANASIESEEAGAAVAAADRDSAAAADERGDIAGQLAKPGLSSAERVQLQGRMSELADARRQSQGVRAEAAAKLASTPMTFDYVSGDVDPGFTDGPVLGAIKDGLANIIGGGSLLLMLVISASPWVFAALLVIWLWRRYGARLGLRDSAHDD